MAELILISKVKVQLVAYSQYLKQAGGNKDIIEFLNLILKEDVSVEEIRAKISTLAPLMDNEKDPQSGEAANLIGLCFKYGLGTDKDVQAATKLFGVANNRKSIGAKFNLALSYMFGQGVERDPKKAFELLSTAAASGYSSAQYRLGLSYEKGKGKGKIVEIDLEKAWSLYLAAANGSHTLALYKAGRRFIKGSNLVKKNSQKAIRFYRVAAIHGYAPAQNALGICYMYGRGVERSSEMAIKWLTLAAAQGLAQAQYNLAVCYYYGLGVTKDRKRAMELYQAAAAQGYAPAQYRIDLHNTKSAKKVIALHVTAAVQGNPDAQFRLGLCYFKKGGKENLERAIDLWVAAAEQGYAVAQFNLGLCYENGQGVEKDLKRAIELYTAAAEQGHLKAQRRLDLCNDNQRVKSGLKRNSGDQAHVSCDPDSIWQNLQQAAGKAGVPLLCSKRQPNLAGAQFSSGGPSIASRPPLLHSSQASARGSGVISTANPDKKQKVLLGKKS